jgi:methylated-DNA-[protein]-cysteine S-methyltransferase
MTAYAYYSSPLGLLEIVCTDVGIASLNFVEQPRFESDDDPPAILRDCLAQLDEYFDGRRRKFDIPLDLSAGTAFYREVWRLVQAIPYGRTRSYSTIAETLGRPNASRAVGQANGHNPVPIIIPCHRVIGKDGGLTGYAYGLEIKEALLAIENPRKFVHQTELFR